MGKFFKINVLSIQLKKEMETLHIQTIQTIQTIQPILALLPAIVAMRLYLSFEAFVQGFQAMNSDAPETDKVHLVVAPTGSGKTTAFIAEMVRMFPRVLLVLCLPRRLACNVAVYLRSQYGLTVAVKHGKVNETVGDLVKPDTQVLIMTYRSAVNMILCQNKPSGRQISLVFDECHESCYEAVMLYRLISSLFAKKPDWLHSIFCVSATMDPIELSKRLNLEKRFIQVSEIEAPRKTFPIGTKHVIPINIVDDEKEATKPRQKKGKGKEKKTDDDKEDEKEATKPLQKKGKGKAQNKEDGEKPKPAPNPNESMQGFARKYQKDFVHLVVEDIITASKLLNESTVVIVDGVNTAKTIIASLNKSFTKSAVNNVRFWNTFVQQECPVKDLTTYHLVIIGSHMKLSSSITFPRCTRLYVSDIMQVATRIARDATVQLFRGLVPNSILQQCFGRGNRDVSTHVFYFQAIFPSDFQNTRLNYPKQDDVSDFILEYIDVSVSRTPAKTHAFCIKYDLNIRQAEEIFFSQLPVELLLALHRYAKSEVSEEKKEQFLKSLNVLRALAHTVAYFSDDERRIVKPTKLDGMSNGNFAQLVGIFVLHILNKVCGCPTERQNSDWESILGVSEEKMNHMVQGIKISIGNDGLGSFACNSLKEEITPAVIIAAIRSSRDYDVIELLPFFLKHDPNFIFATGTDDDDVLSETQVDKLELNGLSILQYGILTSAGGAYISPAFIVSLGRSSEKPQQPQCAHDGSAQQHPQPQKCARVDSAQQHPQSQCARSGSAKPQSQQPQCVRVDSAQKHPQPQCARVDSAQQHPQQQKCVRVDSAQQHPQQQKCVRVDSAQQPRARGSHKK